MFSFLTQPFIAAWRSRYLIKQMAAREITSRYKGSMLGLLWSILIPMLMLGTYVFVFGVLFGVRLESGEQGPFAYGLWLFAGLVVFWLFSEVVAHAPDILLANTVLVKKVVFPLEILPWVNIGAALFHSGVSLLIFFVAVGITQGGLPYTAVLAPVVLLPLIAILLGLSWFLASMTVFFRDLKQLMTPFLTLVIFLSPIFFPLSKVPDGVRPFFYLNPVTIPVLQLRNVMLDGKPPAWGLWGVYLCVGIIVLFLGHTFFHKVRRGISDVI